MSYYVKLLTGISLTFIDYNNVIPSVSAKWYKYILSYFQSNSSSIQFKTVVRVYVPCNHFISIIYKITYEDFKLSRYK